MSKLYLIDLYIKIFEKNYLKNDKTKAIKIWKNIKNNLSILEYATQVKNNNFNSNIIAYMILNDKELYNADIYYNLINIIYSNKQLARGKILGTTFLMLTLNNDELKLTKDQKIFLISEAEEAPYTKKYYDENLKYDIPFHGIGILDLRYKILQNENFTLQEKKNLFILFYPDDEIKIYILEEILWELSNILGFDIIDIDDITKIDLSFIQDEEKRIKILEKIQFYNELKELIPEHSIKKHINND